MPEGKTYRIFWNNHYPNFWELYSKFCSKFNIKPNITLNYWSDIVLTDEHIKSFQKAVDSGFIERIIEI